MNKLTGAQRLIARMTERGVRQSYSGGINVIGRGKVVGDMGVASDGSVVYWHQDEFLWLALPIAPSFDPRADKRERAEHANAVIEAIARHGRRFFRDRESGRVSHFEIDYRTGMLWWRNSWGDKRVYILRDGEWRGFHNGGTLKALVSALRDYIRTGVPINAYHFGPWHNWSDDDDLWGYGRDAIRALRCDIAGNPAVATWTAPYVYTIAR